MIINHNMNAMNANRQMGINTGNQAKSMEKLSSGLRINRAGDDAAGLSISEKMRGQIRGLDQGARNSQDGISLIQTAEGATNETHTILQRMRELAVQSSNGTNISQDREQIDKEFNQLQEEINRIGDQTQFNKQNLLNASSKITFQVGANEGQTIDINLKDMRTSALSVQSKDATLAKEAEKLMASAEQLKASMGTTTAKIQAYSAKLASANAKLGSAKAAGTNVLTQTAASKAITKIDTAIQSVSSFRADLGSVQNRLESSIRSTNNTSENLQAAESRIRDVDMAKEMMSFSKDNILAQAAQAMLAQANQQPQAVLQLLR